MAIKQWNDKEWEEFEARLEDAETQNEINRLIDLTRRQEEHPELYDSACLCKLCCSYGN